MFFYNRFPASERGNYCLQSNGVAKVCKKKLHNTSGTQNILTWLAGLTVSMWEDNFSAQEIEVLTNLKVSILNTVLLRIMREGV